MTQHNPPFHDVIEVTPNTIWRFIISRIFSFSAGVVFGIALAYWLWWMNWLNHEAGMWSTKWLINADGTPGAFVLPSTPPQTNLNYYPVSQ